MYKKIINKLVNYINESGFAMKTEERFLQGEILLESKRNLWNSKREFRPDTWDDFGFKVFSQSNEDGLIQYLLNKIEMPNKTFIEFGVEDYTECNTKFLLLHNAWSGLIMDCSENNMEKVIHSDIYWRNDIKAVTSFITLNNINDLISSRGFDKEVGILSIDIDGNDYWIWDTIDCINPRIVICEFNPIFGSDICVTIPYKEDFYRTDMHYSNLYWGASLAAYVELGKKKGYTLVCLNQMGHNAFFVRNDIVGDLQEVSPKDAYRGMKYHDSRDKEGNLTFLSQEEGLELIKQEKVVDLRDGRIKKICECLK